MAKEASKSKSLVKTESDSITTSDDVAAFVRPITKADLHGVKIERVATIDVGQMISGTYLGKGPDIETNDQVTGEIRMLSTYRFQVSPDVVVRVIGSHQLKTELPQYEGKKIRVMKVGQVKSRKGNLVNDWVIGLES